MNAFVNKGRPIFLRSMSFGASLAVDGVDDLVLHSSYTNGSSFSAACGSPCSICDKMRVTSDMAPIVVEPKPVRNQRHLLENFRSRRHDS